ncbi:MAG: hypothetical protein KAW67_02065, partial [Candidatus Eisenbacteria sp.]|nr:hypothetical protein [Candidatus Eisenbacteria bacterium]
TSGRSAQVHAAARVRAALVWLAAVALLAGVPGCIFSPRDDDGAPYDDDEIPWVTPTDTDRVLQNLAAALAGEGVSNYMDCFTHPEQGGFTFHVDPQDSLDAGQEGEDRYAKWTEEDEATYITGVFLESAEGIDVSFSTVEQQDENDDEMYRREDYELTIVWQSGDHQPWESVTYCGQVKLWMKRDETELWSIFKWIDRRAADPGGRDTWGVLRGDYRQ